MQVSCHNNTQNGRWKTYLEAHFNKVTLIIRYTELTIVNKNGTYNTPNKRE